MSATSVKLSAGRLRLELDPGFGGSISSFIWAHGGAEAQVLRTRGTADATILGTANFPLVPFVNRVRNGLFTFRGKEVRLSVNLPGDPSPLHGQGWLEPWSVEEQGSDHTRLRYEHSAGEWPWSYSSEQRFTLDEGGLQLDLSCRNDSEDPMPCGLGLHPYFVCGPQTRLDTVVENSWTIDDKVLPVDRVPAEGRYSLQDRLVCGQKLDHGFGGWGGQARISDPTWPIAVEISSPDAQFLHVYSPASGGFFAVEPVTHANAALNLPEEQWSNLGLRVLEPGETIQLRVRFDISAG